MKNLDLGILVARLGLGICVLTHGFSKIMNGIGGVKAILSKAGLPEFMAYFAYVGEVLAPLMIILGIFSRIGSILLIGTCLTILYSFHGLANLFELTNVGGFKAEIVYLYMTLALSILFTGSGKYALKAD
ncbi:MULTISPECIES: DoxX family protein [unclassified Campylobacter]|uniref:DoxX family protein n=1 Tax=unclassified Campylobacter TaxID=2593542 RepID=UPI0014749ABA|nr:MULTISPECIES: DoxX family protein [unclassified Campylobacter]QKF92680.1 DoxX family protein [Campylobacter sp. CCUG 57310]